MMDTLPEIAIAVLMWIESSLVEGRVYSRFAHLLVAHPGLSLLD